MIGRIFAVIAIVALSGCGSRPQPSRVAAYLDRYLNSCHEWQGRGTCAMIDPTAQHCYSRVGFCDHVIIAKPFRRYVTAQGDDITLTSEGRAKYYDGASSRQTAYFGTGVWRIADANVDSRSLQFVSGNVVTALVRLTPDPSMVRYIESGGGEFGDGAFALALMQHHPVQQITLALPEDLQ